MSIEEDIGDILTKAGCAPQVLSTKQVWEWQQTWRERFSKELFSDTGKWMLRGLDWHVLNSNYHEAFTKEHALERYGGVGPGPFLVVSGSRHKGFGFLCQGHPPAISVGGFDLLIFPCSLSWTMALTHSPNYGPFFVRPSDDDIGRHTPVPES